MEFFSPEGKPLRASVTLSLVQQEIQFAFAPVPDAQAANTRRPAAGTQPLTQAPAGSTVQGMAAQQGLGDNWQAIAQANGIENPRLLAPGQLINLNVRVEQSFVGRYSSTSRPPGLRKTPEVGK